MVAAAAEAARGRTSQVPRLHGQERAVEEHRRRTSHSIETCMRWWGGVYLACESRALLISFLCGVCVDCWCSSRVCVYCFCVFNRAWRARARSSASSVTRASAPHCSSRRRRRAGAGPNRNGPKQSKTRAPPTSRTDRNESHQARAIGDTCLRTGVGK